MNCTSCNAQLAPGSSHCFFCGTAQSQRARPSATRYPAGGSPGSGASTYGQWVNASAPASEAWRVWASFFLGGLYGPIASTYLFKREEWSAGFRKGALPPAAPSQRGLVVLSLFVGLPMLFIAVLGFVINATEVRRSYDYYETGVDVWYGLSQAHSFGWINLLVAGFFVLSVVVSRLVDRRFEVLLSELTAGDPQAIYGFRKGRAGRVIASLLGVLPLLLLVSMDLQMVLAGWNRSLDGFAALYMLSITLAAWATSWLNISPVTRFRQVLLSRP